ncbi:MAG: 3-deoxy-manno-octulosonate cytidylyltransferase [Deltaproteobacteria bacterium]|nr:3-deoxy-manno-octulosonate cytidylyltransferase [Deltaproteobacteria bacterium]
MKIFALIPARYGSTRFPGKPLALIAGKPMVQHVHECAVTCPDISDVWICTDDERIFRCVGDFGAKAIMTSPTHCSGTDRIAEAAQGLEIQDNDLIVNIQGDQPLFHSSVISHLIAPFKEDQELLMGTLKFRMTQIHDIENPNIVKVITDNNGFAIYFSRHPIPYLRDSKSSTVYFKHIGIYAFRKDFLIRFSRLPEGRLEAAEKLEQLRALENGFKIKVVETLFNSIEVDRPEDVDKIEREMNERRKED